MPRRRLTRPEWTAYHEAGHAVVALSLGVRAHKATIVPDADSDGWVHHASPLGRLQADIETSDRVRMRIEKRILIALAGDAAERKAYKRRRFGGHIDLSQAFDAASHICGSDRQTDAYLQYLSIVAEDLIDLHWEAVERVAKALLARQTLSEAQIREAVFPGCDLDVAGAAKLRGVRAEA